jgi:hypothetical protein
MILEKPDVAAIRLCEDRGMFPTEGELAHAGLSAGGYTQRIRNLSAQNVIRSMHTSLVVPPLLGGDWVWAAVLANASRPLGVANSLTRRLPFVTEVILNAGLPARIGPDLALLFYSRDFDTEAQFIRSAEGMEHHEVYRVAEYSFPMPMPLSGEERELLRFLVSSPVSNIAGVAQALGKEQIWVRAKLDRLYWTERNRSGVVRIQPEIDWTRVENFGHFHFLLETGHRPEQVSRMVSERGFELVLGGKTFRDRYLQVESDVWGIADLMERAAYLNQIVGIRVAGVLWSERVSVNTGWAAGLLE